jgi:hypothetical protein
MASTRTVHRFRFDEFNDMIAGDQTNQPDGGPIYFSTASHPEFDYLSNDFPCHFCMPDPERGPTPPTFRTAEQ